MTWRRKTLEHATRIQTGSVAVKKPQRRLYWWIASLLILVSLCAGSVHLLFGSRYFSIKQVRFHQNGHHVRVAELTQIISAETKGTFFSFSANRLRRRLLVLPWVESVTVRRHWPDGLVIALHERHAVAIWGESALLDDKGAVFYPSIDTFPIDLPRLSARHDDPNTVWSTYTDLQASLLPMGLQIAAIEATTGGAWQLTLGNGVVVLLPRKDTQSAVHRWVSVYAQLMRGHMNQVKRIDLRYGHGLAVQWRSSKGHTKGKPKTVQKKVHT